MVNREQKDVPDTMRKQPVTRRQFLGSGIAAAGAISIGGALPANARDWAKYAARFDRSISDGLPAGPLRPDDETAWKAVAKNLCGHKQNNQS